jgi:hypothetical protein
MPDPLRYLPEPDPSALRLQQSGTLSISNQIITLPPGLYKGGIVISGPSVVTLSPGLYYLQGGGFNISGQASLNGLGVTLYNAPITTTDSISITGQGAVTLSPPTTGPYAGITLFQERSATAPMYVAGNGLAAITGTFYAAHALLNVTGNGLINNLGSQYISYDLTLAGNGAININYDPNQTAKARTIGLVE